MNNRELKVEREITFWGAWIIWCLLSFYAPTWAWAITGVIVFAVMCADNIAYYFVTYRPRKKKEKQQVHNTIINHFDYTRYESSTTNQGFRETFTWRCTVDERI